MLTVKTGMADELRIARAYASPGVQILSGIQTLADLRRIVPDNCKAIISFGLCGGLAPEPQIGQVFIGDVLVTPDGEYECDVHWRRRLFAKTRAYERHWYSSGVFNQADTPSQRADLFKKTGAWIIDDESIFVARFARERGIPFQMMRAVSDGAKDVVPPAARNAINSDGTSDVESVIKSVLSDPSQIFDLIRLGREYYESLAELRTAAIQVGPMFQWS